MLQACVIHGYKPVIAGFQGCPGDTTSKHLGEALTTALQDKTFALQLRPAAGVVLRKGVHAHGQQQRLLRAAPQLPRLHSSPTRESTLFARASILHTHPVAYSLVKNESWCCRNGLQPDGGGQQGLRDGSGTAPPPSLPRSSPQCPQSSGKHPTSDGCAPCFHHIAPLPVLICVLLMTRAHDWGHSNTIKHSPRLATSAYTQIQFIQGTKTCTPVLSKAGCSHTHAVLPVGHPADDGQAASAEGAASPLTHSPPSGGRDQGNDLPASDGPTAPSAQAPAQAAAAPCTSQACGHKRPRPGQCQIPDVTKDRPPWLPDEPLPPTQTASPLPPPPAVSEGQPAHAAWAQTRAAANAATRLAEVSQTRLAFTLCTVGVCHHQVMLSGHKHILLCCSQHRQGGIVVYGALLLASLLTLIRGEGLQNLPACFQQLQTYLQTDIREDLQANKADDSAAPSELSNLQPQAGATQAGEPQTSSLRATVPGSQPPTAHQVEHGHLPQPAHVQVIAAGAAARALECNTGSTYCPGLQLLCAHQLQACLCSTCIATRAHPVTLEAGSA